MLVMFVFSDGLWYFQLYINVNSEDFDLYEYMIKMLDDIIFGFFFGLQFDIVLEVVLCICYQCVKCGRYLYDEEILVGWIVDDLNFNIGQELKKLCYLFYINLDMVIRKKKKI